MHNFCRLNTKSVTHFDLINVCINFDTVTDLLRTFEIEFLKEKTHSEFDMIKLIVILL